jgi:hypothetical protein
MHSLRLLEPFDGLCLGHALSNVCEYATTNEKVFPSLNYASIKASKITWPKKFGKKKQAWDKACIDYGLIKA